MENRGAANRMELKLEKYEINKLNYEKIVPKKGIELKANITTNPKIRKEKERQSCNFQFVLTTKDSEINNIFVEITEEYIVKGEITNEQQFEYEALEKVYPYIREVVANLTHAAEINALFLPVETIPIKKIDD